MFFVVLPLLFATPGFMGWQAEKVMKEVAVYLDGLPSYRVGWQSYNRGWFKSQGVLWVTVDQLDGVGNNDQALTLPLNIELLHGPLLLGENTDKFALGFGGFDALVTLPQEHELYLNSLISTQAQGPLYQLAARMDLAGNVVLHDRWLPFELKFGGAELSLDGYQGTGTMGLDRQLLYSATLPTIVLNTVNNAKGQTQQANHSVQIKGIKGQLQADLANWHKAQVAPGQIDLSAEEFNYNNAQLLFKQLRLSAQTKINNNNTLSYFSQLSVANTVFQSSDVAFEKANMDLSYVNLSLDFLESYYALLDEIPIDANAQYWQNHLGSLILNKLLPSSPKLRIDNVKFSTAKGNFIANLLLSIEGDALKNANLDVNNPVGLLPFLILTFDIKIDMPLAEYFAEIHIRNQVKNQLASENTVLSENEISDIVKAQAPSVLEALILQGFIVQKNNAYMLDFNFKKGQAVLNNQPMPLPF